MEQRITEELHRLGAMHTAPIEVAKIKFSPELRTLCEMNSCGAYGTNWGCRPGCGEVDELARKAQEYPRGIVYQYVGAGGCNLCPECTYPDDPCRFPDRKNVSVEACGINVSVLCAKCGLEYIHGPNTVTNTGVVLFK